MSKRPKKARTILDSDTQLRRMSGVGLAHETLLLDDKRLFKQQA